MEFAACIILCISSREKQIIWSVFLSHAFNFARLKRTSFCAIMTPSAPWWYLNERLSSENSRQWVLLRMRLKGETGTVRENTRNAFTERAKTDLLFFSLPSISPPMLSTIHPPVQDYFQAGICIIVRHCFENTSFFSCS